MPGPQAGTINWDPMTRKSRSRSRSRSGMSRSMEKRRSRSRSNLSRHLSRQRRKSNRSSRTSLLNKAAGDVSQWSMGLPSGSRQSRSQSMIQRRSLSGRSKPRASSVSMGCKSWNGGSSRRMSQQLGMTKQWDPVSRTYCAKPSGGAGYDFTARNSTKSMDLEMQRSRRNSNSRLPPPNQQSGCSCKLVIIIITLVAILACALGYLLIPDETEEVEDDTPAQDDNTPDVAPPPTRDVKPFIDRSTIAVSWMIKKEKGWGATLWPTDQQFWSSGPQTGAHQEHVTENVGLERDGLFKIVSNPWLFGTPTAAFDEGILKKLNSEVDATKSDLCKENLSDKRKAKVKQYFSKWFESLKNDDKLKKLAVCWKYTFHFRKSEVKKKFHADEEFAFSRNIAGAHRFMPNQSLGGHNPAMLGWIVRFDFVMFDYEGKSIPEGSRRFNISV